MWNVIRRADRECACPREKETRRARLKLECPLECCWVVCTGWFSNRGRTERSTRAKEREGEEFNGRSRQLIRFWKIDYELQSFWLSFSGKFPRDVAPSIPFFVFYHDEVIHLELCDAFSAFSFQTETDRVLEARFRQDRDVTQKCRRVIDESKYHVVAKKVQRDWACARTYICLTRERFILNEARSLWYSQTVYIYMI